MTENNSITTFEFVSNTGIGDLIHSRQLLDVFVERGHRVNFIIGVNGLGNEWFGPRLEFLIWLSTKLFSLKGYDVFFSPNKFGNSPRALLGNDIVQPRIPILLDEFECDEGSSDDSYVVILTKVRGIKRRDILTKLPLINQHILSIAAKKKIILLGEREIEYNLEYEIHSDELIYSLYGNFKRLLPNCVDLTIPALGITSPSPAQFLKDCKILSEARAVICFGSGGNVSIAMSVSNIVNFYDGLEMGYLFQHFHPTPKKVITEDFKVFLEALESIGSKP